MLPFLASLRGGFVFDDHLQIEQNDQLRDLGNLPRFFTADVWAAVGLPFSSYYRPLMYTTFALEFAAVGTQPWLYRATNLALHVLVVLLVAALVRRAGGSREAGFIAALLFAVHPMHAEVVAWPSARPELLVSAFTLVAGVLFAGADPERGPLGARFLGIGVLVLLALFSKETGVLAPVLIGAVAMMRSPRSGALARIWHGATLSLPFLALVAVFLGTRGLAIRKSGLPPLVADDVLDPGRRLYRSTPEAAWGLAGIVGRYLGEMLAPFDASSFRVPSWENVRGGLGWVPLGVGSFFAAPVSRAAAWLAFATLAVFVQSLGVPSAGYLSQRYTYLPSVGACAAIAELIAVALLATSTPAGRRLAWGLVGFVALFFAVAAHDRALEWTDEPSLWRSAYARDPRSPAVAANYGFLRIDEGHPEEALALFDVVEEVEPGAWGAPYGRGSALAAMGKLHEAIPELEEAVRRSPKVPQLRQALGFVYEDMGDYENARRVYLEAMELFPDSATGFGVLGILAAKQGKPEDALRETERALALRPDQPQLRLNRVQLLAELGRASEAEADARILLAHPDASVRSEAHRYLGILYDRHLGAPTRAAEHYEESVRIAPARPDAAMLRRRVERLRRGSARVSPEAGATQPAGVPALDASPAPGDGAPPEH